MLYTLILICLTGLVWILRPRDRDRDRTPDRWDDGLRDTDARARRPRARADDHMRLQRITLPSVSGPRSDTYRCRGCSAPMGAGAPAVMVWGSSLAPRRQPQGPFCSPRCAGAVHRAPFARAARAASTSPVGAAVQRGLYGGLATRGY